ncbi:MAG: ribose-phosphate pyrophosphokinase, partial [Clostridia bacterium]|nr:ribose-phosphate pyrophosphokinase [Clostridia bacterium]
MMQEKTSETVFALPNQVAPLSIIAQPGTEELAAKINYYLTEWAKKSGRDDRTFLVEAECPRFSSGDGKGL